MDFPNTTQKQRVVFVSTEIIPDWNRDGTIDTQDRCKATADNPWRFWANDDDDSEDDLGDDISNPGVADAADLGVGNTGVVDGNRDLVDFFPVCLDIKNLVLLFPPGSSVKYKLKQSDSLMNFAYTNLTRDRAGAFQKELITTGFGDRFDQKPGKATTHRITSTGIELLTPFLIPATSFAAGSNTFIREDFQIPSVNLAPLKTDSSQWPDRGGSHQRRWLHCDIREVAFLHNWKAYQAFVQHANLNQQ